MTDRNLSNLTNFEYSLKCDDKSLTYENFQNDYKFSFLYG